MKKKTKEDKEANEIKLLKKRLAEKNDEIAHFKWAQSGLGWWDHPVFKEAVAK